MHPGSGDAANPLREIDFTSNAEGDRKRSSADDVAKMVFTFVTAAKVLAEGMDKADEVKLLRMRTRKNEIVIVTGTLVSS